MARSNTQNAKLIKLAPAINHFHPKTSSYRKPNLLSRCATLTTALHTVIFGEREGEMSSPPPPQQQQSNLSDSTSFARLFIFRNFIPRFIHSRWHVCAVCVREYYFSLEKKEFFISLHHRVCPSRHFDFFLSHLFRHPHTRALARLLVACHPNHLIMQFKLFSLLLKTFSSLPYYELVLGFFLLARRRVRDIYSKNILCKCAINFIL